MKYSEVDKMLIHLINHSAEELGGAQKVLKFLYDASKDQSKIISFDYIQNEKKRESSSVAYAFFLFIFELLTKPKSKFIVHHRIFLIPFIIFRKKNAVFVCHSIFPNKNGIFKYISNIRCIAVSNEVKDYLLAMNPKLDISTIPNGVSGKPSENFEHMDNGVYEIGYVGRLGVEKGIDTLLDAFIIFSSKNRHLNTKLHIVGSGELESVLLEKIQTAKISDKVTLHGYCKAPFEKMKNMDLLVVPSQYEGFGLVYYEALERQHMILASRLPVFSKKDNDSGVYFFSPNDTHDLANKISECHKAQHTWLNSHRPEKRHEFFTVDEMLSTYKTFLRSI